MTATLAASMDSVFVSPFNPYQPPAADEVLASDAADGTSRRATRGQRLLASLLDTVIALAIMLPVQLKLGVYKNFPQIAKLSIGQTLLWGAFSILVWFILHGYFLAKNAQTIGKRLVGIRVEDQAFERPAEVWKLTILRYLPTAAVSLIPYVGAFVTLIDVLFIFRRDQRCIHDHIAGTVVVKV